MSTHYPDKWVILEIKKTESETLYKVFGTWYGGYLGSDSWRLNSGIENITEDRGILSFAGASGSSYICGRDQYGTNLYTRGILSGLLRDCDEKGLGVKELSHSEAELLIEELLVK